MAEQKHGGWWLHLRPEPFTDAGEPERRLKHALKRLLRSHKLRCTRIEPVKPEAEAEGKSPLSGSQRG